jgi:hypothetical protein
LVDLCRQDGEVDIEPVRIEGYYEIRALPGMAVVRDHLVRVGAWWPTATYEQRAAHVRDVLAPLLVSDELLNELASLETSPPRPSGD